MDLPPIHLSPVSQSDLDDLVAVRFAAMRPSLERAGRFDPLRARERFTRNFVPAHTYHIECMGHRVGFVVLKPDQPIWLLEHLYVLPEHQDLGIGSATLRHLFAQADQVGRSLRVGALRGSDANRFYLRHGFKLERVDEWDIYYLRQAHADFNPASPRMTPVDHP